jgi:hypothetical protein
VVSLKLRPLYPQTGSLRYLLDRRLGGPQSRSGHGVEEKKVPAYAGNRTPVVSPVAQSVTEPTEPQRTTLELRVFVGTRNVRVCLPRGEVKKCVAVLEYCAVDSRIV